MIIKEKNCIFVHIPKNAGQAIESEILQELGEKWSTREKFLLRKNDNPSMGPPRLAHLYASEYLEKGYVDEEYFKGAYKFAVVRNPYARLVSEYRYRAYLCSFETFVKKKMLKVRDNYDNGKDLRRHLEPQVKYIFDSDGNKIVDDVFKLEELKKVESIFLGKLGMKGGTIKKKNETGEVPALSIGRVRHLVFKMIYDKGGDYKKYYNEETRKVVSDVYSCDLKEFQYSY
ncbi:sulfotransferase family 2 domain-containing protein [Halomonas maura]|uniref:sulfotransferase family 2 domain-containing protein n=1 Tax=Halomonas maura TaxID=117606 RepID=UPI0025B4A5C0|nr:sulfotransferase family 2 domain-containing protein [Halomonas maura]MDN3554935.1 sulfotransferase family 2 domain-containing protein [Halomonas maura]